MPAAEEIRVGSSWRYGEHVYDIHARRPIEPGWPAWTARHLVLAVPRGQDPQPLDRIPDTWLRRYLTPVKDDAAVAEHLGEALRHTSIPMPTSPKTLHEHDAQVRRITVPAAGPKCSGRGARPRRTPGSDDAPW